MRLLAALLVLLLSGLASAQIVATRPAGSSSGALATSTLVTAPAPRQIGAANSNLLPAGVSAYALDLDSGTPLYTQNAQARRPIASITKLMTTYLILSRHQPSELVTIKNLPSYDSGDQTLGISNGETFHLIDLVRAALIASDDDAADALAINDAGSTDAFVQEMNATAVTWGAQNVHFASASGLADENNYANAAGVATIAQIALTNSTIKQLVAMPSATITNSSGTSYYLTTTDDLLANGLFYGIKTGYTAAAGQCFVGLTTINGHQVITVVLGSSNRFVDTLTLRNWIEGAWTWQ